MGLPLHEGRLKALLRPVPADAEGDGAVVLFEAALVELELVVVVVDGGDQVRVGWPVRELVHRPVLEDEHLDFQDVLGLHPVLCRLAHKGGAALLRRVEGALARAHRGALQRGTQVGECADEGAHLVEDKGLGLDLHEVGHAEGAGGVLVVLLQNLGEGEVVHVDEVLECLQLCLGGFDLLEHRVRLRRLWAARLHPAAVRLGDLLDQHLQLHVDLGGPPVDFLDLGVDPRDEVALARARRTNHLIGRRNGVREVQDVFIELTDAACVDHLAEDLF
mmetsp:Transcript_2862/g.8913  ORF Transcript_2862/g.8913 Transcript_2862/m.8913 type:complete len:276 (-) Transcript_2862:172-999(-)